MKEIEGLEFEVIGILRRIHQTPGKLTNRDIDRMNEIGEMARKMNERIKIFGESCQRLEMIAKALDPDDFNAKLLPWDMLHATFSGIDKRIPRKPKPDPLEEIYG